jgi:hypothetical protein
VSAGDVQGQGRRRLALGLFAALLMALTGCGHGNGHFEQAPGGDPELSAAHPAKNFIYGRILTTGNDEWTIYGIKKNTYNVQVTSVTMFGNLLKRQPRDGFKTGDPVRIAGEFVGTNVIATAVEHATDRDLTRR